MDKIWKEQKKYALGLALPLPEYHIIPKIVKWLDVSSSWLLYGEKASPVIENDRNVWQIKHNEHY